MPYRILRTIGIATLCIYFVIGMYISQHGDDRYPFFSWFLFATIPNRVDDFTIEILVYDGKKYDPPLPLSKASFLFQNDIQKSTEYLPRISRLGTAIKYERDDQIAIERTAVEKMFMGRQFTYQVVRVAYDPVEYWKSGALIDHAVVAVYKSSNATI